MGRGEGEEGIKERGKDGKKEGRRKGRGEWEGEKGWKKKKNLYLESLIKI